MFALEIMTLLGLTRADSSDIQEPWLHKDVHFVVQLHKILNIFPKSKNNGMKVTLLYERNPQTKL